MKKTLIILCMLQATVVCFGMKLVTTVPQTNYEKEVLGVVYDGERLLFATYQWSKHDTGYTAVMEKELSVDLAIPSILVGGEISYIHNDHVVLYANGRQIQDFSYLEAGWLETQALGWIYVESYPVVYSVQLGKLYVYEAEELIYWIYNFSDKSWNLKDLRGNY